MVDLSDKTLLFGNNLEWECSASQRCGTWVDARLVTGKFKLTVTEGSPPQDSIEDRLIMGSPFADNHIIIADESRNSIVTGDRNDRIEFGPKGGSVTAHAGKNEIYCNSGRDQISIYRAGASTYEADSDANLTTIHSFQAEQDVIKIDVPTEGRLVAPEVQRKINETVFAFGCSATVSDVRRAAADVEGVEDGQVFWFSYCKNTYVAIDNPEHTLLKLSGVVELNAESFNMPTFEPLP
jgi:hypothetical protein